MHLTAARIKARTEDVVVLEEARKSYWRNLVLHTPLQCILTCLGLPKVPRRQFYCQACQRYFTEILSFADVGRQYTRRYEEFIYQQVQLSSIEQVSRVERLSFDRIQGIFKHQYAQQKKKDGKTLNVSASMKSVSVKDIKTLSQFSAILKPGS